MLKLDHVSMANKPLHVLLFFLKLMSQFLTHQQENTMDETGAIKTREDEDSGNEVGGSGWREKKKSS